MTQTALDWRIEGFYARYIDAGGKCRAMVRVDPNDLTTETIADRRVRE